MSKNTTKATPAQPADGIGSRRRKPDESTYGFPNHEDGIQTANATGEKALDPAKPQNQKTAPSGPGSRNGNGMAGS